MRRMLSTGERRKPTWPWFRGNVWMIVVLTVLVVLQDCCVHSLTTFGRRPATGDSNQQSAKRQKTGNSKVMEPAFATAGQNVGLQIWRIEVSYLFSFIDCFLDGRFTDLKGCYSCIF